MIAYCTLCKILVKYKGKLRGVHHFRCCPTCYHPHMLSGVLPPNKDELQIKDSISHVQAARFREYAVVSDFNSAEESVSRVIEL